MKRDSHNSIEPFGEMTDSQLDELLELAQPAIDRRRQKRLQRGLGRLLKTSRPSSLFNVGPVAASGLVAAACGVVFLGWIGWRLSVSPYETPKFRSVAKIDSDEHAGVSSNLIEPAGELKSPPSLIVTRVVSSNRINRKSRQHSVVAEVNSQLQQVKSQLMAQCVRLGESEIGLRLVEQWTITLDDAIRKENASLAETRHRGSTKRKESSERAQQLAMLQSLRNQIEMELVRMLHDSDHNTALTAFRLLCRCGAQRSLPTILKHWDKPYVRSDVAVAAARLANTTTLGQLIEASEDGEVRSIMMAELLRRNDSRSVDLFLELTTNYELHSIAQASGAEVKEASAEFLLRRLQSNRWSIARAAAITLSKMDDSRIPPRLMELMQRPETRQSAVMALTARRDAESVRFVELASRDLRSLATVNSAKKKWGQLAVAF